MAIYRYKHTVTPYITRTIIIIIIIRLSCVGTVCAGVPLLRYTVGCARKKNAGDFLSRIAYNEVFPFLTKQYVLLNLFRRGRTRFGRVYRPLSVRGRRRRSSHQFARGVTLTAYRCYYHTSRLRHAFNDIDARTSCCFQICPGTSRAQL